MKKKTSYLKILFSTILLYIETVIILILYPLIIVFVSKQSRVKLNEYLKDRVENIEGKWDYLDKKNT